VQSIKNISLVKLIQIQNVLSYKYDFIKKTYPLNRTYLHFHGNDRKEILENGNLSHYEICSASLKGVGGSFQHFSELDFDGSS